MKKISLPLQTSIEINLYPHSSENLLIIVHGASEGALRYHEMAEELSKEINVITYNHPGHETGESVSFSTQEILDRSQAVIDYGCSHYKNVSIFAHSMGSLVIRNLAAHLNPNIKVILSGSPSVSSFEVSMNKLAEAFVSHLAKEKASTRLNFIAFDQKNSKIGLGEKQWICSDKAVVADFLSSKLHNQLFNNQSLAALIHLVNQANSKKCLSALSRLDLMLVSGHKDVFTKNGHHYKYLTRYATKAKVNIYPNSYHEVHNDKDKEQLFKDIIYFIKRDEEVKN